MISPTAMMMASSFLEKKNRMFRNYLTPRPRGSTRWKVVSPPKGPRQAATSAPALPPDGGRGIGHDDEVEEEKKKEEKKKVTDDDIDKRIFGSLTLPTPRQLDLLIPSPSLGRANPASPIPLPQPSRI